MSPVDSARALLERSELILTKATVLSAMDRMAAEIGADLKDAFPLVLSVMGGAVVFTGHLLPLLDWPLEFDVLKASRYGQATTGGTIRWSLRPQLSVRGRAVLILDDILDEGATLAEIVRDVKADGASTVRIAVLFDKAHGRPKPVRADYVGLTVPDRYVFGWGMDVAGFWRNLDTVRALNDDGFDLLK